MKKFLASILAVYSSLTLADVHSLNKGDGTIWAYGSDNISIELSGKAAETIYNNLDVEVIRYNNGQEAKEDGNIVCTTSWASYQNKTYNCVVEHVAKK